MGWYQSIVAASLVVAAAGRAPAQVEVFVTDFYNNSIRRVSTTTGANTPPAVNSVSLPSALAIGPDGLLWTSSQGTASIIRINTNTGLTVSTIPLGTQVTVPGGIAFAPNGDFFVADFVSQTTPGTGTVKRFSSTGTFISTVATGLNQPSGLLFSGSNLYITETNTSTFTGGRLSVYNGTTTTPLSTGTAGTGFAGMALTGSTLLYADLLGGAIHRFDIGTNTALTDLVAPGGSLNNQFPSGLLVESSGSVLVANLGGVNPPSPAAGSLQRYSSAGVLQTTLVNGIFGSAVVPVPEPTSLALVGAAIAGTAMLRRRRKK
ncbi:MAG: PEP-CTERM sorting domain-containing protein [Gemmataceae bacterium]